MGYVEVCSLKGSQVYICPIFINFCFLLSHEIEQVPLPIFPSRGKKSEAQKCQGFKKKTILFYSQKISYTYTIYLSHIKPQFPLHTFYPSPSVSPLPLNPLSSVHAVSLSMAAGPFIAAQAAYQQPYPGLGTFTYLSE